jgi:hypothetical protein
MTQNTQTTTDNDSSGTRCLVPVECAVAYGQAGLSVLAASREGKRPLARGWKNNMTHRNTEQQTRAEWKRYQPDALCVVCGKVSGNLEVIDFDNHGELFDKWKAAVPQQLYDRLVVEQSQSGGFHVAYRCKEEVKKGDKLAYGERNGRRTTLIETRAEGNVILCAPSDGYVLKQGDWRRLPLITSDERGVLLSAAKAMDECQEDSKNTVETRGDAVTQPTSIHPCNEFWEIMPIDDFKQRGDIHPYLEKAGWVLLRTDDRGEEYWRRPGQPVKDRHGATLTNGVFHIFSCNAAPFEIDKNYDKFDVYALLEHGGDVKAAVASLAKMGFGRTENPSCIDFGALVANVQRRKDGVQCGNVVISNEPPEPARPWRTVTEGDVADAIEGTLFGRLCNCFTSVADPPLPIAAGIAKALVVCGGALSRPLDASPAAIEAERLKGNVSGYVGHGALLAMNRINTGGGQGCNFYTMLVAPSSSGKDIGGLLDHLAMEYGWYIGDAGSAEGIADALIQTPNGILSIPELQPWLDKRCWQHNAVPFLTSAFNKGFFKQNFSQKTAKGGLRRADYCYPNIIASVQPETLRRIADRQDLANGFLGRFLYARMPSSHCQPNIIDLRGTLDIMHVLLDAFCRKFGEINVEKGYSRHLWEMFEKGAPDEIDFCWKRLSNEYYPRFAFALSLTDDPATQTERTVLRPDDWLRAEVLVKWFFAGAEKLLLGIEDTDIDSRIRFREHLLERVCRKLQRIQGADGWVTISRLSQSGIRHSNGKERREALDELCLRGIAEHKEGEEAYRVINCPPEWLEDAAACDCQKASKSP